jgi:hypothetical protein
MVVWYIYYSTLDIILIVEWEYLSNQLLWWRSFHILRGLLYFRYRWHAEICSSLREDGNLANYWVKIMWLGNDELLLYVWRKLLDCQVSGLAIFCLSWLLVACTFRSAGGNAFDLRKICGVPQPPRTYYFYSIFGHAPLPYFGIILPYLVGRFNYRPCFT